MSHCWRNIREKPFGTSEGRKIIDMITERNLYFFFIGFNFIACFILMILYFLFFFFHFGFASICELCFWGEEKVTMCNLFLFNVSTINSFACLRHLPCFFSITNTICITIFNF